MDAITSFRGKYAFLANSYSCMVTLDGMNYPSVEHAYQAAKTFDIRGRQGMQVMRSAHDAYYFGKKVTLRDDWKHVKGQIMLDLLRQKFCKPRMIQLLLETGDREIIYQSSDMFWGNAEGKGKNLLGQMLMQVRSELQKQAEEHKITITASSEEKYDFLSNSFACTVTLDGMEYPSVEHAYQAAKSFDIRVRRKIQAAPGAAEARQIGETALQLVPREDWGTVHTQIMLDLLWQKFHIPEFAKALLQTEDLILMPKNENGDLFWSRAYHKRQNKLGGMLTRIRAELQKERG